MIRTVIIALTMLALCTTIAPAQEKKESGTSSWFRNLQKKINIISPKKTLPVSTGVAGVRGAKEESGKGKLYWKGKTGEEPVTEVELAEFKEGIAFVEAGKKAEAIHEFEEFLKIYPDSPLIPDARKSLDLLKEDEKSGTNAAPKDEGKAAGK